MGEEKDQLIQLYEEEKAQAIEEEKAQLMLSFEASKNFFEEKQQELSDKLHGAMDRNEFLEQDLTEFEHEIQEKVEEKIQLENELELLKQQQLSLEGEVVNYASEKINKQREERLNVAIFETVVESYKSRLEKSERDLDLFKSMSFSYY